MSFPTTLTQCQARSLWSGLWRKRLYRDLCVLASLRSDINALSLYEADSSPILLRGRPHREVQPADVSMLLQQQFVIILPSTIRNIQQDRGVADHLLLTRTADIHRTACHMVRRRYPTRQLVHRRRAIARVNHDTFDILRGLIILAWLQTVERIIAIPQFLQPPAEPLQILTDRGDRSLIFQNDQSPAPCNPPINFIS